MTVTTARTRRSEDELRAIAAEGSARFADAGSEAAAEVLAWAAEHFGDRLAVACSMAGDTVVVDLAAAALPGVDVLFLDTGYHFAETLGTRAALQAVRDVHVVDVQPEHSVAEQDSRYGKDLFARDPGRCCQLRKVEPLDRSLAGYEAWVTGLRREDNVLRANAPLVEWDERHHMVKINPVAPWSFDELLEHAENNQVPVNPLLADGYPSIGCKPCTRRVAEGEDPRAGRWAGLGKTECGIHL
jgi:phosphoadenosine phosphosulfate reductase